MNKCHRLEGIHFDIRGPVVCEAKRLEKQGIPVLYLNIGNPAKFGLEAPSFLLDELKANLTESQAYCDAKGIPQARYAIAESISMHGTNISMDDIYIGNGVSELIEMTLLALLNPGDEVLIPSPDYPLWTGAVQLASGKAVHYLCDERSAWMPDVSDIKRKITSKTKAIVLINPNNPTGAVYTADILQQIVALARENHLIILADEVYNRLVLEGYQHISIASIAGQDVPVVTYDGLSKSHQLCGWRIAWAAFSGMRQEYSSFIDGFNMLATMRVCANALVQTIIPAALADRKSYKPLLCPGGRFYERLKAVSDEINKSSNISCVPANHSFYVFPKINSNRVKIINDEQFCMDLLRDKHIVLTPGSGFQWPHSDHFRIVCLPEVSVLRKAVQDIDEFLSDYHQL